ncbi:MAG: hypothetical protein HYT79_04135 [Elusimicrobia bacterium]|nr:hypothetical protein [Elusimicrobiota bacterium]
MSIPDPDKYVAKLIELHGGRENFFSVMEAQYKKFLSIWEQDAEKIGRVLRAHLAVEHFLAEHIQATNPKLGSLDNARLSFAQKIDLLDEHDRMAEFLKPGLRRLNQIRNRLAHKLKMDIDAEDREAFLAIEIFRAMRDEGSKRTGPPADDPLSVIEQFAKFASGLLQTTANPQANLWKEAYGPPPD